LVVAAASGCGQQQFQCSGVRTGPVTNDGCDVTWHDCDVPPETLDVVCVSGTCACGLEEDAKTFTQGEFCDEAKKFKDDPTSAVQSNLAVQAAEGCGWEDLLDKIVL